MSTSSGTARAFSLPLLTKDLVEQAARPRTYLLRVAYAAALFLFAVVVLRQYANRPPAAILGAGRTLLAMLAYWQAGAIIVLLPMLTCGAIALEKERQTLPLLLLTRLSGATIVVEKLLARLVPMTNYLLLSLPLFAIAYGMGGVAPDDLWRIVRDLALLMLEVGTLAIACSAIFRTSVGAMVACYLVMAIVAVVPSLAETFGFFAEIQNLASPNAGSGIQEIPYARWLIVLLQSLTCFAIACGTLWRHVDSPPRSIWRAVHRWLDAQFHRMNDNPVTRGVVLIRDHNPLPVWRPVAWRELTSRPYGSIRSLVRIFVWLQISLVFIVIIVANSGSGYTMMARITNLYLITFTLGTLAIAGVATDLVSRERSRQTLDVLLSTPLSGRGILLEKLVSLAGAVMLWTAVLATIVAYREWLAPRNRSMATLDFVAQTAYTSFVPLWHWAAIGLTSASLGLRMRSRTAAMLNSLAIAACFYAASLGLDRFGVIRYWEGPTQPTFLPMTGDGVDRTPFSVIHVLPHRQLIGASSPVGYVPPNAFPMVEENRYSSATEMSYRTWNQLRRLDVTATHVALVFCWIGAAWCWLFLDPDRSLGRCPGLNPMPNRPAN